jgi:hypothetical protein
MGLSVALEHEDGTQVELIHDDRNLLHVALRAAADPSYAWSGTIDWYGDTTFNYLQAARLRQEWARLISESREPDVAALLRRINALIERCASGRHLYLTFYGD